MPCVFVFVPTGNQQFPGQELFQKSSCQSVTCHREQLKESTIPSLICPKKLLSLSCFRNVRKLLFFQIYYVFRTLILQKKYQKKYEKYIVKFLLLAVALHQLLLYGRCAHCGHSIKWPKAKAKLPHGELSWRTFSPRRIGGRAIREVFSFPSAHSFPSLPVLPKLPKAGISRNISWFFVQVGNTRFQNHHNHNPKKFADFQTTRRLRRLRRLLEDFLKILSGQKSISFISLPLILCSIDFIQSSSQQDSSIQENNPSKYVKHIQKWFNFVQHPKKHNFTLEVDFKNSNLVIWLEKDMKNLHFQSALQLCTSPGDWNFESLSESENKSYKSRVLTA